MRKQFDPEKYYGGPVTAPKTHERPPESTQDERTGISGTVTTRSQGKAKQGSQGRIDALKNIKDLGL